MVLPGIFLAVPLLIVGAISFKGLSLEMESEEIRSLHERQAVVRQAQTLVLEGLTATAQDLTSSIRQSIDNYTLKNTRNMAAYDAVLFYLIMLNNDRIFPPPESTETLVSERFFLESLNGNIKSALKKLENSGRYLEQVRISDYTGSMTFFCDKDLSATVICILMTEESVNASISKSLMTLSTGSGTFDIKPSIPARTGSKNTWLANYLPQNLSPPLHHFTVYVARTAERTSLSTLTVYSIIGLPLLVSWALLMIIFYKNQRFKITEAENRTQLAAHLAHDLRTPLANLKLYGDLLDRNCKNPLAIKRYAGIMKQEINSLERLSERTIQAAYGNPALRTDDEINLLEFVQSCILQKSALIESSLCEVRVNGPANGLVFTDPLALESILIQLVENAINHAQTDRIDIHVDLTRDEIVLQVRDFGSGVRLEHQQEIFNPGFRAGQGDIPGHGLGLSGIRHLVRRNGGDIQLLNATPGSAFIVKIPTRGCV